MARAKCAVACYGTLFAGSILGGMNIIKLFVVAVVCLLSASLASAAPDGSRLQGGQPPEVRREFRAAWVATVANIDWPSKPGLTKEEQIAELEKLMDVAVDLRLNALIFQVRPACDALYESELEPWSAYLTGEQGKSPGYDPLAKAIELAHARGIELHTWFNPYRASHPTMPGELAENHISKTKPDVVKTYGKYLWLDPSEPAATEHTVQVMLDVVKRYDVDGVHFDDYFYPYPIKRPDGDAGSQGLDDDTDAGEAESGNLPFPDTPAWKNYLAATPEAERLSRDDWRRKSVNDLIERLSVEIKEIKPWVQFGISPFGIWRPGHPESIRGFDAYDALYADSKLWLQKGWVDYFTPQLYWPVASKGQSYPKLLAWWHESNTQNRHLWPGNFTSRCSAEASGRPAWPSDEVLAQIEVTRDQPGAKGNVHFSMKALVQNYGGVATQLKTGPYSDPALPPATPWLNKDKVAVPTPIVHLRDDGTAGKQIEFRLQGGASPWRWIVQTQAAGKWTTQLLPGKQASLDLSELETKPERVSVKAVNRLSETGPAGMVLVP